MSRSPARFWNARGLTHESNRMKVRGLGRGLDALLGGGDEARPSDALRTLPVAQIRPGRYQPRTKMDQQALAELAASIRSQGVIQPLLVRPVERDRYELVAGERRWRAAQMAGLEEVPALVREVPDEAALAMSLIENIQRENLNPMEEAAGIQRLVEEFKMTHEQAADAVGRSRSATTNLLRLLKLAKPVQEMLMEGALEMGHARALLALDAARQIEAGKRVAAKGLSVRETEALVSTMLRGPAARRKRADRDLARLEEEISERLGTTVEIRSARKAAARVVVHFSSLDHLDGAIEEAAMSGDLRDVAAQRVDRPCRKPLQSAALRGRNEMSAGLGVLGKPVRTAVIWQASATAVLALVGALLAGVNGAISAVLGGVVSMLSGVIATLIATRRTADSTGGVLFTAARAEGVPDSS